MSEHWSEAPAAPHDPSAPGPAAAAAPATTPRSLLEQMQELLASVNADLAGMGAALQSSGTRPAAAEPAGPALGPDSAGGR